MAIIYRTTGAWGSGIGVNLTPAQVDENFYDLDQRVVALEDETLAAVNNIASITVIGSQMTITMEDASTFGPFTLPVAMLRWRGEWQPSTVYDELDLVFVSGIGTFLVMQDHTSELTFDPNEVGEDSEPLYFQIYGDTLTFLQLEDAPDSYAGSGGFEVLVKEDETGLEFVAKDYNIYAFWPGTATADEIIHRRVAEVAFTIPTDLLDPDSHFAADTPTITTTVSIKLNGSEIGVITFADDDTQIASIPETSVAVGDILDFVAVDSDVTFGNIALSIRCKKNEIFIT